MAERCGEMEFILDGEGGDERVENVPTFRYLVISLFQTDDDWPAVQRNIMTQSRSGGTGDTALTVGGRNQGVVKFLQGSGAVNSIVWVGDVVPFFVNSEEGRGETHVFTMTDHGEESKAIRRQNMGDARGRKAYKRQQETS